jgi:hypothetical protein
MARDLERRVGDLGTRLHGRVRGAHRVDFAGHDFEIVDLHD